MGYSRVAIFTAITFIAIAIAGFLFTSPRTIYRSPDSSGCDQSTTTTPCEKLLEYVSNPASHPALLTVTSTYASDILGVAFDYPAHWGIATTTYTQADPQSSKGYAGAQYHLIFTGGQVLSPNGQVLLPDISVDDYGSSHYFYEGPNKLIEYWGQPLENICTSKSFLNKSFENATVERCEYHTNAYGVRYVWVRASGDFPPYGLTQGRIFSFLGARVAYAMNIPDQTSEGFIVPTKSTLDLGMTISESFWSNGYGNPGDNEANEALLPDIKDLAESLRYTR